MSESAEHFLQVSRKYLAPLESKKDELEFDGHKAAEAANKILENTGGYIGVAAIGSMVGGYADENSDIDLVVFLEDTAFPERSDQYSIADYLEKRIKQESPHNREISCIPAVLDASGIREIVSMFPDHTPREYWFRIFSPTAIGPKIEEYRKKISDEIRKLSPEEQQIVIAGFARAIVIGEKAREDTIRERIYGTSDEDLTDLFIAREVQWREQIEQILQLDKKE